MKTVTTFSLFVGFTRALAITKQSLFRGKRNVMLIHVKLDFWTKALRPSRGHDMCLTDEGCMPKETDEKAHLCAYLSEDAAKWRTRDIGERMRGGVVETGLKVRRAEGGYHPRRAGGRHVTSEAGPGATVCRSPATRPHTPRYRRTPPPRSAHPA